MQLHHAATLVIVDMQPIFAASRNPDVVVGVTKQIMIAMQKDWSIIFLEYKGSGKTHPSLLRLTKDYDRKLRVKKTEDDGSQAVVRALKRRPDFSEKNLFVCGVNADCCVRDTVYGLLNRIPAQINVVKDACGTINQFDWRSMKHPRLKVV